jgi:hypothetical protein
MLATLVELLLNPGEPVGQQLKPVAARWIDLRQKVRQSDNQPGKSEEHLEGRLDMKPSANVRKSSPKISAMMASELSVSPDAMAVTSALPCS